MVDDVDVPVDETVVEEVKTRWEKVQCWFYNSLTVAWAWGSAAFGIVGAALIATFSDYDFTQLAAMDVRDAFKMLATLTVTGIMTYLARRRTL